MTVDELNALADSVWHNRLDDDSDSARLARAVLDLLAESAPCGWKAPSVGTSGVRVPDSWAEWVTPDDARALARMLLRAADDASKENQP